MKKLILSAIIMLLLAAPGWAEQETTRDPISIVTGSVAASDDYSSTAYNNTTVSGYWSMQAIVAGTDPAFTIQTLMSNTGEADEYTTATGASDIFTGIGAGVHIVQFNPDFAKWYKFYALNAGSSAGELTMTVWKR